MNCEKCVTNAPTCSADMEYGWGAGNPAMRIEVLSGHKRCHHTFEDRLGPCLWEGAYSSYDKRPIMERNSLILSAVCCVADRGPWPPWGKGQ